MGKLLSPQEVALMLGVTTGTLAQWRFVGGRGPRYIKLSSRQIRYNESDVDAWLRSLEDDQ